MKPRTYECIPWRVTIPATPVPAAGLIDWDALVQRETLQITGLATDFFTTAAAQREADRMLRACREQVRRGNRYALTELLDDNPAFILVEWVRETYLRLLKGGLPLRRPGRTRGKHMVNPLVIRALVDCLVERQEVPNREQAFHYLADKGLASYYAVRSFYYRGRQDSHFQPVYFEFPERSVRVPASIAEPFLARVRILEAGSRLQYRGKDPRRGRVDATFAAL